MDSYQQYRRSDSERGKVHEFSSCYSLVVDVSAVDGDSIIQTHAVLPRCNDALYFRRFWLVELEVGTAADPSQRDAALLHFVFQTSGGALDDRNCYHHILGQGMSGNWNSCRATPADCLFCRIRVATSRIT